MMEVEVYQPLPVFPAAMTWNPADVNLADIVLSNGNLTATTSGIHYADGRSTRSKASGKFYSEFKFPTLVGTGSDAFGLANASAILDNVYVGQDVNGIGVFTNAAALQIFYNGGTQATYNYATFTTATVFQMAVDFSAALLWVNADNGNWNANASANPATGVGGLSISGFITGAVFAAFTLLESSPTACSITANFGATAYAFTPPVGFGNW